MSIPILTRREFIKIAGLGVAGLAASSIPLSRLGFIPGGGGNTYRTQHVVVVQFSGGVRRKETIDKQDNIPNLARIARQGVVNESVAYGQYGHISAQYMTLTGVPEPFGIRSKSRPSKPYVYEYIRKEEKLSAAQAWHIGPFAAANYSTHPEYGQPVGANLLMPGLFGGQIAQTLKPYGAIKKRTPDEDAAFRKLLDSLDTTALPTNASGCFFGNDEAVNRAVEEFLLDQLTNPTNLSRDLQSLKMAQWVLNTFQPALIGVSMMDPDVAHRNLTAYEQAIRNNDAGVGALWDAIQQNPKLRDTTALIVVPEFGRDEKENREGGLDHSDKSEDFQRVFLIGAGPDFKKNQVATQKAAVVDVASTIAELLGFNASLSQGQVMRWLFS